VGAIQPSKGFDFLIYSLGYLAIPKPPLRIIGNTEIPEERVYLERLANEFEIDLQIEVGVSLASLVRSYNEASLVLYAPRNEPFGLVPIEAMACGTPVIAVNEGGVRETVIHNKTGFLIERDPYEYSDAINQLTRNPNKIIEFGKYSREYVAENWTWDHSVLELEKFLESFI
jgi:glycosyltransferase involved in cell wall biosynthesis